MKSFITLAFTAWFLLVEMGCSRNPSVLLNSAGPHARETAGLFWFFCVVDAVVFTLVLTFLFVSLWRRRVPTLSEPMELSAQTEHRLLVGVSLAVGLTALILTIFVGASFAVDHRLIELDKNPDLSIEITAHQWWWEVRYLNDSPSQVFTTANEIHVPIHAKVRFILIASDVIHSLWFPNLSGKKDMIPGRDADLFIRADEEGEYIGRCAEFCGMQHANMGLKLFVESPAAFENWKAAQLAPAFDPQTLEEKHGQEVFTSTSCNLCHTIRTGTTTGYSSNAPDLTHLKSRSTIGAGAAPNSKGYLGGWITDPHGIKPGVHMPTILHEPKDFQSLLAYLETLK